MAAIFEAAAFEAIAGGSAAVPGAEGKLEEDAPPAWPKAIAEAKITAGAMENTNLGFMGFALTPWITADIFEFDFFNLNLTMDCRDVFCATLAQVQCKLR
jgi:hypothetical protein